MSDDLTSAFLLGAYEGYKAWKDEVEFEARVARLLSDPAYIEKLLPCWCYTPELSGCLDKTTDCRWCRLKVARLAVEEEMDA